MVKAWTFVISDIRVCESCNDSGFCLFGQQSFSKEDVEAVHCVSVSIVGRSSCSFGSGDQFEHSDYHYGDCNHDDFCSESEIYAVYSDGRNSSRFYGSISFFRELQTGQT